MTATLHKLSAGDGYTYLTRQVMAHDATSRGRAPLVDYYVAKGERPGVWAGRGLTGLTGGPGAAEVVTEAQMKALFGEGINPNAHALVAEAIAAGASPKEALSQVRLGQRYPQFSGEPSQFLVELGREYQEWNRSRGGAWNTPIPDADRAEIRTRVALRIFNERYGRAPLDERELAGFVAQQSRPQVKAVAGYDVTFSPQKSVSTLWALGDSFVSGQVVEAHDAAVTAVLKWLEDEVAFTRRGAAGVRQVEVTGLIAARFTHRDSRAGDPDLHTHVAISNKVQALDDGAWRALDGAVLFQATVAASERYNTLLEAELEARLGVRFVEREPSSPGLRAVREIAGIDPALMQRWSSRRREIDVRRAELAREFLDHHGRPPTPKEAIELAQQANLETREAKHEPRSEAEQRTVWRQQAEEVLGGPDEVAAMLSRSRAHRVENLVADPQALSLEVLGTVVEARARFADTHVMAEALRRVRGHGLTSAEAEDLAQRVTALALADAGTVDLSVDDLIAEPVELRRSDGRSVYERAHSRLYTTLDTLAAEERIVSAAHRADGRRITADDVAAAGRSGSVTLNRGQATMVREIAVSGARAQLVLAPAGSGKTTAMSVFADAWRASGGTLVGLAPSAVAAGELGESTGIPSTTIAAFLLRPDAVNADTMILIDEAGMASTRDLDAVVQLALAAGASVRLVGDDQQLASVQAGGVLRDIAAEVGSVSLTELMRFEDPAEGAATLAIRDGEHSALGFYLDRGRVQVADSTALAPTVVDAWLNDRHQGRDAIMMAFSTELVTQMNSTARAHRLAAGEVSETLTTRLRSGLEAGVGDVILTRRNDRRTRMSRSDWVKNGDRWAVRDVREDGSLVVAHLRTGRLTTLAASYVAAHVDLGYATTIHAAQGVTADSTHTLLSGSESRQLLYVALSRGRLANTMYVTTSGQGDPHDVLKPDHIAPLTATDVLHGILDRDGSQRSARTEQREASQVGVQLTSAAARYQDAVDAATANVLGAEYLARMEAAAESAVPGVTDAPAWEACKARMARLALSAEGVDPVAALAAAAASRELDTAGDIAAVLHWRLGADAGERSGPLPWLPGVPALLARDPHWRSYLGLRAARVQKLAQAVRDESVALDETDLPSWARTLVEDRALIADIAVWRSARHVPDTDDAPLGPRPVTLLEHNAARPLRQRMDLVRADDRHPAALLRQLRAAEPRIQEDPWMPVLLRRLDLAQRAGVDVTSLLQEALTGPLPDDHPAAAVWYRVAGTLAPVATLVGAQTRLLPDWSSDLAAALPEGIAARVMRAAQWPALVAAVESARDAGHAPQSLLATAAALTRPGEDQRPLPIDDLTAVLAWRVTELVAHHDEAAAPPHPDDHAPDQEIEQILAQFAAAQDASVVGAAPQDRPPIGDEPPPEDEPPADWAIATEPEAAAPTTPVARIIALNETAAAFWRQQYHGKPAAYVASRFAGDDLSGDPSITIGYAPAGRAALTTHLRAAGATDEELVDAGLSRYSRRGDLVDVFRDRVLVGLRSSDGHLVGFSGRAAPGAGPETPKYINTRTTAAFTKGEVMFGLTENRDLLDQGAVPTRVEGWFDAIAVTKAGGGTAVGCAPLGTALTAAQAEMLAAAAAGAGGVVLYAADSDRAGHEAAARDYLALALAGADPRRLVLVDFTDPSTDLKDPAEAYQRDSGASLSRTLAAPDIAPGLVDQLIAHRIRQDADRIGRDEVPAVVAAARDIGRLIAALPPEQWDTHIGAAADMMGAAGSTHEHDALVARETVQAAASWQPPTSAPTAPPARSETPHTAAAQADRISELARRLAAMNAAGAAARAARELTEPAPPTADPIGPENDRGVGPELA